MTLSLKLPEPKISFSYSGPGKGDLNWHPFERWAREKDLVSTVRQVAERWIERLLTEEQKNHTVEVKIPSISWGATIDPNEPHEAVERLGRTIASYVLLEVYKALGLPKDSRAHWPALPETADRQTLEQHLAGRVQVSEALLAAARQQWDTKIAAGYEQERGKALRSIAAKVWAETVAELGKEQRFSPDIVKTVGEALTQLLLLPDAQVFPGLAKLGEEMLKLSPLYMQAAFRFMSRAASEVQGIVSKETYLAFVLAQAGVASQEDWVHAQARHQEVLRVKQAAGESFPAILVPTTAPELPSYSAPRRRRWLVLEGQLDQNEQAALPRVEAIVEAARGLPSLTDAYHLLELQQLDWLASANVVEVTAGQLLRDYLRRQKEAWGKAYLKTVFERELPPREALRWRMPEQVRFLDDQLPGGRAWDPDTVGVPPNQLGSINPLVHLKARRAVALIERAWALIQRWVAPELLNQVPPCRVVFATKEGRAHHHSAGGKPYMLITPVDDESTVMHEFGHHLEEHLPAEVWYRASRLVKERSGGEELVGIHHPAHWEVGGRAELGYTSTKYAARYYGGTLAATEVVSVGMEALYDPAAAFELYVRDPQLLAMLLQSLQTRLTPPKSDGGGQKGAAS
ncbi:MAG: hypothetical protein AB7N76_06145 [Planctomycetota bacterium]